MADEHEAMMTALHVRRSEALARGYATPRSVDFEAGWLARSKHGETKLRQERERADNAERDLAQMMPDDTSVLVPVATLNAIRAGAEALRDALRNMVSSPIEFEDERLDYVVMQVDRDDLVLAAQALMLAARHDDND